MKERASHRSRCPRRYVVGRQASPGRSRPSWRIVSASTYTAKRSHVAALDEHGCELFSRRIVNDPDAFVALLAHQSPRGRQRISDTRETRLRLSRAHPQGRVLDFDGLRTARASGGRTELGYPRSGRRGSGCQSRLVPEPRPRLRRSLRLGLLPDGDHSDAIGVKEGDLTSVRREDR
jgi:hypothetical protein